MKKQDIRFTAVNGKRYEVLEENTGRRCGHCGTGMQLVKIAHPILFGQSLKYIEGEAFFCPSCQKELLAWYQFREIEKKIRVEWENSFGTRNSHVCHNCLFHSCRPAYLDFFCICPDSPYYMQKSDPLQTQMSCICFEDCRYPAERNYLESPHLILRKFRMEDALKIGENFGTPAVRVSSSEVPIFQSVEEGRGFLSDVISRYSDTSFKCWCICQKETGEPVGMISAAFLDDHTAKVDWTANKEWVKTGELSEACWFVLDYLFAVMNVEDVHICCRQQTEKLADVMSEFRNYEISMIDAEKQSLLDSFWYLVHKKDWKGCFDMV